MVEIPNFSAGSSLTDDFFNEFQREYVEAAYDSWKTWAWTGVKLGDLNGAGSWGIGMGQFFTAGELLNATASNAQRNFFVMNPTDIDVGAIARSRAWRLKTVFMSNSIAPGASRLSALSLSEVTGIDGSGFHTVTSVATIPVPTLTANMRDETYSSEFSVASTKLMTVRFTTAAAVADSVLHFLTLLQHRET